MDTNRAVVRLTSGALCCCQCCGRCCFRHPAVELLLPGQVLGQRSLHSAHWVWGHRHPPQAVACSDPGCPCCLWSRTFQDVVFPQYPQDAWPRSIASWPEAGTGVRCLPLGVDARPCGALLHCSSRSGHSAGQTAPTTGFRRLAGWERLVAVPSRTRQWSNSHTCALGSVAPGSPPNQSWRRERKKAQDVNVNNSSLFPSRLKRFQSHYWTDRDIKMNPYRHTETVSMLLSPIMNPSVFLHVELKCVCVFVLLMGSATVPHGLFHN